MIGQTLGHYRILKRIGVGGMGEVYLARDERLERDVAVKVLPAGMLRDDAARKRFRKEALALSRLNHPNIQTIHDFDTQDGVDFLVTEYVPGATLTELLASGALPEKEIIQYSAQIAEGLTTAHEQGVVHRDLKPGNVRVTPEGRVKILDFGLALLVQPSVEGVTAETLGHTHVGAGTLPYMAPEQLRGEKLDARTDLYALGTMLYEMAAGQLPFPQQSAPGLITAILHQAPQPPRERNIKTSPALEQIVLKALEKNPEYRYQSARDMLADLRRMSALGPGAVTAPQAVIPRHLTRRSLVASGLALAALLAGSAVMWRRGFMPPAAPAAPARPTLAVLPFRALSGQPADSELALGLADAIVTGLGGSKELTVRPTRAVLGYQDKLTDPVEAGKALQVESVLDGTLQKSGSRLRINVQLWRVSDRASVWSRKYDVQADDVFAVQDEIGSKVAEALRVELGSAARLRLSTPYSKNPEVYALLLRGRSLALSLGQESLRAAIPTFEGALRTEPDNALAHAWLADAYQRFTFFYDPENALGLQNAESHAQRAIELDASLAEAYAAQAGVAWSPQNHFQADRAVMLYRKALALNPNLASGRAELGRTYCHVGLFDRAIEEHRRAIEIDPKNVSALQGLAEDYVMSGQPRRAEEAARVALGVDPDYALARWELVESLVATNKLGDAEALLRQEYLAGLKFLAPRLPALIAARRGKLAEAEALAARAAEQGRGYGYFHHLAFTVGQIYALAGKKSQAVEWLRRAADAGMPAYPLYQADPDLKSLRGHPEFERFLDELRQQWERRKREL